MLREATRARIRVGFIEEYRVPITPRASLPLPALYEANGPRDALVQFCDKHAWRIAFLPMLSDPVVAVQGVIRPDDRREGPVAVRVAPVDVVPEQCGDRRYDRFTRYPGTYRLSFSDP